MFTPAHDRSETLVGGVASNVLCNSHTVNGAQTRSLLFVGEVASYSTSTVHDFHAWHSASLVKSPATIANPKIGDSAQSVCVWHVRSEVVDGAADSHSPSMQAAPHCSQPESQVPASALKKPDGHCSQPPSESFAAFLTSPAGHAWYW